MKLFEIANDYENILSKTFDPETGEVNEDEMIRLGEIKKDVKEKSVAVASYIKNIEAEKKAIEEAKKSMEERERRLNNQVNYLTEYLKSNMERCGINEISCAYFVVKIKKCPISVELINEEEVPEIYRKRKEVVSIDKIKIKEDLLSNVMIPGASLKQNLRLEIK